MPAKKKVVSVDDETKVAKNTTEEIVKKPTKKQTEKTTEDVPKKTRAKVEKKTDEIVETKVKPKSKKNIVKENIVETITTEDTKQLDNIADEKITTRKIKPMKKLEEPSHDDLQLLKTNMSNETNIDIDSLITDELFIQLKDD